MRNKGGSDAVLEADLATLSSRYGGNIDMGGQKKAPVDQKTGAGGSIGGDTSHGGAFAGKNGGLGSLGLADPFTEAQGIAQNTHDWK